MPKKSEAICILMNIQEGKKINHIERKTGLYFPNKKRKGKKMTILYILFGVLCIIPFIVLFKFPNNKEEK